MGGNINGKLLYLGNRQIKNNIRIIVSNNGTGYEMHCPIVMA